MSRTLRLLCAPQLKELVGVSLLQKRVPLSQQWTVRSLRPYQPTQNGAVSSGSPRTNCQMILHEMLQSPEKRGRVLKVSLIRTLRTLAPDPLAVTNPINFSVARRLITDPWTWIASQVTKTGLSQKRTDNRPWPLLINAVFLHLRSEVLA